MVLPTGTSFGFTACVSCSSSLSGLSRVPLVLGAVKPDRTYISPSCRNALSTPFFGSALRWSTVPSSWSSCLRSKAFQHARAQRKTEDQVPPLSTILQNLVPPPEPSSYADAAECIVTNIGSGWDLKSNPIMDIYKTTGVQFAMYVHPNAATPDRLAALSLFYWLLFMLDDACFDISNPRLVAVAEEFGVDTTMRHDRSRMGNFWKRLRELFRSTELPSESVPVEKAVWNLGRRMRSLSASETWFDSLVETVEIYASCSFEIHFHGSSEVTSHEGLKAYINTRVGNAGADLVCCATELATGKYLSAEARNHPQIRRLTHLCGRFCTLQNDLCSYHKEIFVHKETAGNTIEVMIRLDNHSFAEAVQRLMDIMVADSSMFVEIEQDPQVAELTAVNDSVRSYILGLKDLMSGILEYHQKSGRYRTVDNPFYEMRL